MESPAGLFVALAAAKLANLEPGQWSGEAGFKTGGARGDQHSGRTFAKIWAAQLPASQTKYRGG
jgi:hypothetical protein